MKQQFHRGDLVHVAADLGPSMSHFTTDIDAIVIGSYADQYGASDPDTRNSYTLYLKGEGETSWYYGNQLTLLEHHRLDLLKQWKRERKAQEEQVSDLDWLFAQDYDNKSSLHGASIEALARDLGCTNLWGRNGEGITWYEKAMATVSHAAPFLKAKDKQGWLDYAAKYRKGSK